MGILPSPCLVSVAVKTNSRVLPGGDHKMSMHLIQHTAMEHIITTRSMHEAAQKVFLDHKDGGVANRALDRLDLDNCSGCSAAARRQVCGGGNPIPSATWTPLPGNCPLYFHSFYLELGFKVQTHSPCQCKGKNVVWTTGPYCRLKLPSQTQASPAPGLFQFPAPNTCRIGLSHFSGCLQRGRAGDSDPT